MKKGRGKEYRKGEEKNEERERKRMKKGRGKE